MSIQDDTTAAPAEEADAPAARKQQRRRDKRDVHGWVVLDKPVGMTSTHAVSVIKRLFSAKRAGHAGTLDPLASGCLPIALGEATKTVTYLVEATKGYRFTARWGQATATDDAEGDVVEESDDAEAPRTEPAVVRQLGIPFYVMDFQSQFRPPGLDGAPAHHGKACPLSE